MKFEVRNCRYLGSLGLSILLLFTAWFGWALMNSNTSAIANSKYLALLFYLLGYLEEYLWINGFVVFCLFVITCIYFSKKLIQNKPIIEADEKHFWSVATGNNRIPYKDIKSFEIVKVRKVELLKINFNDESLYKEPFFRRVARIFDGNSRRHGKFQINLNPTDKHAKDVIKYLEKFRLNASFS